MNSTTNRIGILGSGKLGITLARLAVDAGYEVYIAGSGHSEKITLTVQILSPGAYAVSVEQIASSCEVVILALPLNKFKNLPKKLLAGKLVIDAMNYWWEVDGNRDELIPHGLSSSEAVQAFLSSSNVVKAFNHMGYHDLHDEHRPRGTPGRKAIAIAGDDEGYVTAVSQIVDSIGFDPLPIGKLSEGRKLEPSTPAFGANVEAEELTRLVASCDS